MGFLEMSAVGAIQRSEGTCCQFISALTRLTRAVAGHFSTRQTVSRCRQCRYETISEVCTARSAFSSETHSSQHTCQHWAERQRELFLGLAVSMVQPATHLLPINPAPQITLKDVNRTTVNRPQIQSYYGMCFYTLGSIVVQARCLGCLSQ